jgi:hypothetical protein
VADETTHIIGLDLRFQRAAEQKAHDFGDPQRKAVHVLALFSQRECPAQKIEYPSLISTLRKP